MRDIIDIVLVGNGPGAVVAELGDVIDSAKNVVRFNAFNTFEFEAYVGSRTDTWACNQDFKNTGTALRNRAEDGFSVSQLLMVPCSAHPQFEQKVAEMKKTARLLFPGSSINQVDIRIVAELEKELDCRPTTGLITAAYFIKEHGRIHITGFDTLRGHACPPRHYWGGERSNIQSVHRPDAEGKWLQKQIGKGCIVPLDSHAKLDLTSAQHRERMKYLDIYSKLVARGARHYGSSNHAKGAYKHIKKLNPQSVVDVGCGNGEFCRWLRGELKTPRVFALDWAAVPDLPPSVVYWQRPVWDIPLPDKSVDFVTAFDVLEHLLISDVLQTLDEFVRVAKKGMIFSISFEDSKNRAHDGSTLHPTVRSRKWWVDIIQQRTDCAVENWSGGQNGYLYCAYYG